MVTGSGAEQPTTSYSDVAPTKSSEKMVRTNGVNLCVQTFGDPAAGMAAA